MASPYSHLRRRAHFSPSSIMLCAVEVVWFVAEPQGAPVPQTTLKPSLVIEPQQTLLPQITDVPFTNTFVPQTTELPQTSDLLLTTPVSVSKETLCLLGSTTAGGAAVEAS